MDTPSPCLSAVECGDIERVRMLKNAGEPMDHRALHLAIRLSDTRMVLALLFAGADPDAEGGDGP